MSPRRCVQTRADLNGTAAKLRRPGAARDRASPLHRTAVVTVTGDGLLSTGRIEIGPGAQRGSMAPTMNRLYRLAAVPSSPKESSGRIAALCRVDLAARPTAATRLPDREARLTMHSQVRLKPSVIELRTTRGGCAQTAEVFPKHRATSRCDRWLALLNHECNPKLLDLVPQVHSG